MAGDWHWPDRGRMLSWFPWPTLWDPNFEFGQARFQETFRFPPAALAGIIAQLGGDWSLAERLIYFVPYAFVLPVSGWLLARQIACSTRWTLLAPLILMGNSYFLIEGDGHVPIVLAESIACLSLVCAIQALRTASLPAALLGGLLLGTTALFDPRIAYLTVLLLSLYWIILVAADPSMSRLKWRAGIAVVVVGILLLSQAYWWLPLVTYHGEAAFPIPPTPDSPIITLGHGLASVSPYWTGAAPAKLVQAPLNPALLIMPLIALLVLVRRRLTPEVLWLALAAMLAAFAAKTDNPPLGFIYDRLYADLPGWKLFREGSKFLFIDGIAYAVLVPMALRQLATWQVPPKIRLPMRAIAGVAIAAVVLLQVFALSALQSGQLGSTTQPAPEPAAFSRLSAVMAADDVPGPVLWFGAPLTTQNSHSHYYTIASPNHSLLVMSGVWLASSTSRVDAFQHFCSDASVPYCYLEPALFQYLAQQSDARYIVAPVGSGVGNLPSGITRPWLVQRLTAILNQTPNILGAGDHAIAVWRRDSAAPRVFGGQAVAIIESGTWSTTKVLPAITALGLPVAYRQSFDSSKFPPAPAVLPRSVLVVPNLDGGCRTDRPQSVAILARSSADTVSLARSAGSVTRVPLLLHPQRLAGWSLYGPITIDAAFNAIAAPGIELGPCVAWNELTEKALAAFPILPSSAEFDPSQELVTATMEGRDLSWVELREGYDPGWELNGARMHVLGNGLFNLYYLEPKSAASGPIRFQFSTLKWERGGQVIGALTFVSTLSLMYLLVRRRSLGAVEQPAVEVTVWIAPVLAAAAVVMLGQTVLATAALWSGLPSMHPVISPSGDPYGLDVTYGGVAIFLVAAAVAVGLVENRVGHRSRVAALGKVRRVLAFVLVGPLLAGCGGSGPTQRPGLVAQAQTEGQPSPATAAQSLDDARLHRLVRDPNSCIRDYSEALRVYTDLVDAWSGRADCYMRDNPTAAVHDYSRAIELRPLDSGLYLKRAIAYRATGNLASATADYQQALEIPSARPSDFLAGIDGLMLTESFPFPLATAEVKRATVLFPHSASAHVAASDLRIALDDDGAALDELGVAQQLAVGGNLAEAALVWSRRCAFDLLRHSYGQAESECTQAVQLKPESSGSYDDRAAAELALGDESAANADLSRAIGTFVGNVGPDAQPAGVDGFGLARLYEARGHAEMVRGSPREAQADFNRALAALPAAAPDFRARLKEDLRSVGA